MGNRDTFHFTLRVLGGFGLVIFMAGCQYTPNTPLEWKNINPPQDRRTYSRLLHLAEKQILSQEIRNQVEQEIHRASTSLGVPESLLWCLLFNESEFNITKNVSKENHPPLPSGIGMATSVVLDEINHDLLHYDTRTHSALTRALHLSRSELELEFTQSNTPTSYYQASTGVFATGVYLNNRYSQLKQALDHLGIAYSSEILWLYTIPAYKKGLRSVYTVFTHELMSRGDSSLSFILKDVHAATRYLIHEKNFRYPLSQVWTEEGFTQEIEELIEFNRNVLSCTLPARYT